MEGWQDRVLEDLGIEGAASLASTFCEDTPMVYHSLKHNRVEASYCMGGFPLGGQVMGM